MTDIQINILVVFANPMDSALLRLGAEDRAIRESLYQGSRREIIRTDICHATNFHDLRRALLRTGYQILQFSGHSDTTGLFFEDNNGLKQKVEFEMLAPFLAAHSPPLECVLLNACSTLEQGRFLALNVPFVIAMRAPIADNLAIEFSRGFYDALAAGKSIEFAYQEGCRCVKLLAKSQGDLPVLVKQATLDKYQRQPLGIRSVEYNRWYQQLSAGKLEITLDPAAINEVNILVSIVDKTLLEKGYEKVSIDRTAVILWELISNVARHVPGSPALIGIEINETYLPLVIISVADNGTGLDLEAELKKQLLNMKSGEPEHGIGRIFRLSDSIEHHFSSDFSPFHTVFCTLYSETPRKSFFTEFPWCSRVTISSSYVWFGTKRYTPKWGKWGVTHAFNFALEHGIPQILEIYMDHLLLASPFCLVIECRDMDRRTTEAFPFTIPTILKALETYFAELFKRKSVVLFLSDGTGTSEFKEMSKKHKIELFVSEDACRKKMKLLAKDAQKHLERK